MAALTGMVSGKIGYVQVFDSSTGVTTDYPMGEWQFPMHAEFIKRNSFLAAGYQVGVSGFKSAKPVIRGPYAYGYAPITVGGTYTFVLGIDPDGPYEFQVTGHVSDIVPSNSAEGAPEIEVTLDSIGEFDIVTV